MRRFHWLTMSLLTILLVGCGAPSTVSTLAPTATAVVVVPTATTNAIAHAGTYGPNELRLAYQVNPLLAQGFDGSGQTIVDIVSFGDPTIQSDLDAYSQHYGLPQTTVQVIQPLGPNPTPTTSAEQQDQAGWAGETALDVEVYHALAPGAKIVVMESPISETEGIQGLPQFRQLIQYVLDHHLGSIISNSWGASEATLQDAASQAELALWNTMLQNSTTTGGITYLASSGDFGATDAINLDASQLSPTPTTSFVTDSPWVTSVGGTALTFQGTTPTETAWSQIGRGSSGASGGGFSAFYKTPNYQQSLPATTASAFQGRRGVPDVAADASPATGLSIYVQGGWQSDFGGTSAAAPQWAALVAIADQMAGKPIGFLNPLLYKLAATSAYATDFHDITVGNNSITAEGVSVTGYTCAVGWDPVTGLGTPDAANLLPALVALAKSGG